MFMVQGNVRKPHKFLVYKFRMKLSMFGNVIINKLQMWNINKATIYNLWGNKRGSIQNQKLLKLLF